MGIAKIKYKNLGVHRNLKFFDFNHFIKGINSLTDESIQNMSYAKYFKNFTINKGALKTGLGLKKLTFWSSLQNRETEYNNTFIGQPLAVYAYPYYDSVYGDKRDVMFVYTSDNKLFYMRYKSPLRNFVEYENVTFTAVPDYLYYIMPDGTESAMFCTSNETLKIINFSAEIQNVSNAPIMKSLCVHYDRIFAVTSVNRSKVWFSDELDPTNWNVSSTEAGYISMNDMLGDCVKVLSFNGYVYVFREYGITRISAYATQESFSMINVYSSSNFIYSNTACICGDVIYFLATDGLYAFDGVNVSKINVGFEKLIENIDESNAHSVYYKNCYCIILNTNLCGINTYSGLNAQNTLIKYNCINGYYDILTDIKALSLEKINTSGIEKLVVVDIENFVSAENFTTRISQVDYYGEIYNVPTVKEWQSPTTDLGYPNYEKNICKLAIQTKYPCYVAISTDKMSQTLYFDGKDTSEQCPVFLSGTMVNVKIYSSAYNANISHPTIYYKLGRVNA